MSRVTPQSRGHAKSSGNFVRTKYTDSVNLIVDSFGARIVHSRQDCTPTTNDDRERRQRHRSWNRTNLNPKTDVFHLNTSLSFSFLSEGLTDTETFCCEKLIIWSQRLGSGHLADHGLSRQHQSSNPLHANDTGPTWS